MTNSLYSREVFTREELRKVSEIALGKLEDTSHGAAFRQLLIAVTLAQGAALHQAVSIGKASRYLDGNRVGVKDIDVWCFFRKVEGSVFNPRWRQGADFGESKFGRSPDDPSHLLGRRIDIFGRSIPVEPNDSTQESIRRWLEKPGKGSHFHLRQKAIIGLFPESILEEVIWVNPDLI